MTENNSQSIFITLATLKTKTSVPGEDPKMQAHTLVRDLYPTAEEFENAEKLLVWADSKKVTHSALQLGVKQFLVLNRACFKACKKADTWSVEYGQKNSDAFTWPVQEKPSENKGSKMAVDQARYNDCMSSIANGLKAGMTKDQIVAMLGSVYTVEMVTECYKAIMPE